MVEIRCYTKFLWKKEIGARLVVSCGLWDGV